MHHVLIPSKNSTFFIEYAIGWSKKAHQCCLAYFRIRKETETAQCAPGSSPSLKLEYSILSLKYPTLGAENLGPTHLFFPLTDEIFSG